MTEREQAEEDLRVSKERYRLLFDSVNDAVVVYTLPKPNVASVLIEANQVACQRLGYSREELLTLSPTVIEHPVNPHQTPLIAHKLQSQNHAIFEAIQTTKTGQFIPVEVNAHLFSLYGEPTVLSVARDITERKELEARLHYITMHDSLTKLFNRTHFDEEIRRLDQASDIQVGVIIGDVDGLKLINDSMGHQAGDDLLIASGNIISQSTRERDFVARIGGDEFAVILYGITTPDLEKVCGRIRANITLHNLARPGLPLSISLGYSVAAGENSNIRQRIKEADDAMYHEKFNRSQDNRNALVRGLMKALESRDFISEGQANRLPDLIEKLGRSLDLTESDLAELRLLAQFHDFGKVAIPDQILFKPTSLSPEEQLEMQRHCEVGHRIAQSVPDITLIADRILKHHEWWNGQGYPLGISGDDIPLDCRIFAIADAYDAMTSDRPYRKAMSCKDAKAELERCKGVQFDPHLVDKFAGILQ